jgi:hypothetical protein
MWRTGIIMGLCLMPLLCAGCGDRFADLVGVSETEVLAELGPPQSRRTLTIPNAGQPDFYGPRPPALLLGETYISLNYPDDSGTHHIYLVSPAVFQRLTGRAQGDDPLYVLHVAFTAKGVWY